MSRIKTVAIPSAQSGGMTIFRTGWKLFGWKGTIPYIAIFLLWELFSRFNIVVQWFNPLFFPPPTEIVRNAWVLAETGIIGASLWSSTIRILQGFTLGTVSAIGIAMMMSRFRHVEFWVAPLLNLTGPIPALALLPLFIIWFGIGEFPKVLLIAWTTFVPMLAYTLDGLKSVNPLLIRSATSLGASQRQIFTRVILPSAIPNILVGSQVGLGLAFSALIVSEMMGASSGLGYIIVDARNYFKISNMFVAIVFIGLEYSLFSQLLKLVEKRVMSWRKGGIRDALGK
ncbi:ABC transporter permease [Paenibacillus sp. P96]|uniref:ABC transporter permease n=1 Tax=Paenibacillus zeirhizosphaerae TaxID=2987519 RepID=A0ABT9FWZ1_9BACL|nr:ABC transporter permease [Paenibacillus sp. P96]MDP4099256.1 ABC transporter permease [Paenibacillus sp. P96]